LFGINSVADLEYYFENCEIAGAVSAIMIIPWRKCLKPFPVALVPTCLRFNQFQIKDVWNRTLDTCVDSIKNIFGCTPIGWASDGCSVRVPIQWYSMSTVDKRGLVVNNIPSDHSVFTIRHPSIGLRAYQSNRDGTVRDVHFQDCFHVLKCAVCVLLSPTRDPTLNHRVNADLILQAVFLDHQLGDIQDYTFNLAKSELFTKAEIEYKDRMNVLIAQRYISVRIQNKLDVIIQQQDGAKYTSTREYLRILCQFRMMFYAVKIPFRERVKYCGHILTFMYGWYHWIKESKFYTLKTHFVTMQANFQTYGSVLQLMASNIKNSTRILSPPCCD